MKFAADLGNINRRLRKFQIQSFQVLADDPGNCKVAKPFVVGRDHIPGRMLGAALGEGVFIGGLVVVP